jgi:hypothetical protein
MEVMNELFVKIHSTRYKANLGGDYEEMEAGLHMHIYDISSQIIP